ncbi:beta-glucosidase [Haploplasma axanthum]|uniref:Thermostable beta-glucosidase B n=1 Tax=Haploplasma axanthum TaxID=29552 RepID=A0A449BD46_HAPAX|nr:glycoside hydrolase family 3 N-terminal domain-containing protein [Haploplasma axanthum]VEU80230.1 Thermostable beta-glucosidase B [Haploplasma axanthum]
MKGLIKKMTMIVLSGFLLAVAVPVAAQKFYTDFTSYEDVLDAGYKLNEEIASEGFVLLKNENESLPLVKNSKISAFGKNTVNPVYGGSGSGSGSTKNRVDFYTALRNAGFDVNKVLENFYLNNGASGSGRPASPGMFTSVLSGFATGETPIDKYTSSVESSYSVFNDAAVIMISRIGGEGYDLPVNSRKNWTSTEPVEGVAEGAHENHYLQLTKYEEDLIKYVDSKFENVILIINSSNTMELGFVQDMPEIDSAIWIGGPGANGLNALGKILNGEVNPSGRLTDIHARDFKKDPTWFNFAKNTQNTEGNQYVVDGKTQPYYYVDYEEGIYLGYKYYETRAVEEENSETWYNENVVYPFGYGLSYTNFTWEIEGAGNETPIALTADTEIAVKVKVTNNGSVAGKEVVQLYYTAPYTNGGIEKAHVVLGAFEKTKLLKPGQSQTVELKLTARDMASYDYTDANNNGKTTWELDNGEYGIKVMKNSHEVVGEIKYNLATTVAYENDEVTNEVIKNRFDDVSFDVITPESTTSRNSKSISERSLSRADFAGTFPTMPTLEDRTVTDEFIKSLNVVVDNKGLYDKNQPWATTVLPNQAKTQLTKEQIAIHFSELAGVRYTDENKEKWEAFMDQFTIDQLAAMIGNTTYALGGNALLADLGVVRTENLDGPSGFGSGVNFAAEIVIASTFNKELAYKMGQHIGNEALWTNAGGWYAPGMNIHRSPFSGRNFEYYSEDAVLSGLIGAATTKGATDKGVIVYIKHFALNDQETDRTNNGVLTYANEQAIRELYLRPFEMSVKDGEAHGVMSSFNSIGSTWAGGSYALLTEILRDEWGFEGVVVTDMWMGGHMKTDQMVRAGNDLTLGSTKPTTAGLKDLIEKFDELTADEKTYVATQVFAMRKSARNALVALANSLGMQNGIPSGSISVKLQKANAGLPFNYDIKSNLPEGFDAAEIIEYKISDGGKLPQGLTLTADGKISGTPLAGSENTGVHTFSIDIIADGYITRKASFEIEVDGAIYNRDTKLVAIIGQELEINLAPVLNSTKVELENSKFSGSVPGRWGAAGWDGKVPSWLKFGPISNNFTSDNILKGTPTEIGVYEFEVRIQTTLGTFDVPFTVEVKAAEPEKPIERFTFVKIDLPTVTKDANFSASVAVASETGVTYTLKDGSQLPQGLVLSASGTISGKTSVLGNKEFTVIASKDGFEDVEATFTIVVEEQKVPETPVIPEPVKPNMTLPIVLSVISLVGVIGVAVLVVLKKK